MKHGFKNPAEKQEHMQQSNAHRVEKNQLGSGVDTAAPHSADLWETVHISGCMTALVNFVGKKRLQIYLEEKETFQT